MRITRDDRTAGKMALAWALLTLGTYGVVRYPGASPILLGLMTALAIGAMDRTAGEARRFWAWAATTTGAMTCGAILVVT